MPDLDEFFESRIRGLASKRISLSRGRSYTPPRFEAGTTKGGQFAPKGMGSVAYSTLKKLADGDGKPGDVATRKVDSDASGAPSARSVAQSMMSRRPAVVNPDAPYEDIDDYMRPERRYGPSPRPEPRPVPRGGHRMRPDKMTAAPPAAGRVGQQYVSERGITWATPENGKWWTIHQRAVYSLRPDGDGFIVQIEGNGLGQTDYRGKEVPIYRADSLMDAVQWVDRNHSTDNRDRWQRGDGAIGAAVPVGGSSLSPYGRGIWRVENSTSGTMTPENAYLALREDPVFLRLIDKIADDPSLLRQYVDADGQPTEDGGQRAYVDWYQAPRGRRDPERSAIYTPVKKVFAQALVDGVAARRDQPTVKPTPRAIATQMLFGRTPGGRAVGSAPIWASGSPVMVPDSAYDKAQASVFDAMRDLSAAELDGASESRLAALQKKLDDANSSLWFAALARGSSGAIMGYSGPELSAFGDAAGSASSGDFLSAIKFTRDAGLAAGLAREWLVKNPDATGPDADAIRALLGSSQTGRDFLTDVRQRKFGTKTYNSVVADATSWLAANPGESGPEVAAIRDLASGRKSNRGIWKGIAGRGLTGNKNPEAVQKAARERNRASRARPR